ncbi:DNA-binding transcriptional regulator, MarR family [Klenkia marina]|uniref:DNA-binding transcriptional regulator, MarR family n=1 Tax=Klenkia marina TaxID=1960309 RepID=A0A1G4XHZ4_9ACTN|nr:MarR family transcriptional regulator [Klenkia marina]SCX40338.1 DNA-binding transcriptional regulator, MarR family [Klenkia marina]
MSPAPDGSPDGTADGGSAGRLDPQRLPRAAAARVEYVAQRLARALTRSTEVIAARHGVSVPEYRVLLLLGDEVPRSNAELARLSFVTAQASHLVVAGLVRRGLARRAAHPDNRRIRLVGLTERGAAVLDACVADVVAVEERLRAGLPARQREQLLPTLTGAAEVLAGGFFGDADLERAAADLRRQSS